VEKADGRPRFFSTIAQPPAPPVTEIFGEPLSRWTPRPPGFMLNPASTLLFPGRSLMPTFVLTDVSRDLWVETFSITSADLGEKGWPGWSVTKRTLRGGRREGVDLVQVENGALSFSVLPTRGMGLWKGHFKGDEVGWRSPVTDGPVHPALVNLSGWGGLGWLDGFDELLARCGLEHNGAPFEVKAVSPDGSERHTVYGLHGRIANIPAHYVAVHVSSEPPHEITVEGHVDESRLFGPSLRMVSRIRTIPGSNRLTVHDEIENRRDLPARVQLLYHWNFGPPHLDPGARFLAPVKTMCPRDPRAREGLAQYDVYAAPEPGYAEQVYLFELLGQGPEQRTLAMLRNSDADRAVALRFSLAQLPCFTLWKNTGGLRDGYVTGLEPATNYPNAQPFEVARNRFVKLDPGARFTAETTLELAENKQGVAALEAEIKALQAQGAPTVHPKPAEPFAMEA
jgi:hypothetical protein